MADAVTADLLLGGRYRLTRPVARGGMAEVWEAEDGVLGRRVAVKILHPHLASDDSFRERFRREAIAVARLTHPAVVAIYDTGDDGELVYLVMELVEGRTLRDILVSEGALDPRRAVALAAHVADGLAAAHERGIIHRDVKPGNLLVMADGRAKLTDFGIARGDAGSDLDEDLTQVGTFVGTAKYVAPEQVAGGPVDARTDVYALGLVLYEMLCGRPAFDEETDLATALARTQRLPLAPRQLRVDVPRDVEAIVLRALAIDPDDRYASATEFRNALLSLDVESPDPTPETPLPVAPPDDRRFTVGVLGVVGLAVAVALSGFFFAATETGRSVLERVRDQFPGGDEASPIAITGARDFDPEGDQTEHPELVAAVHDGDPNTAWKTDLYRTREFGNLKSGVGVVLDLDRDRAIDELRVRAGASGWDAEVYVGDGTATSLAGWGSAVVSRTGAAADVTFDLGGLRGRSVLLWLTLLPASGQLEIGEVEVAG